MDKFLISNKNYEFILSNLSFMKNFGVSKIYLRDEDLSINILNNFLVSTKKYDIKIFINYNPKLSYFGKCGIHLKGKQLHLANDLTNIPISYSAHSLDDVLKAYYSGVSYIFISPIFFVENKNKPLGIEFIKQIPLYIRNKIFALGGIDSTNITELEGLGIAGVAGIRMFL
ncbi:thiamine phosphate synthase [Helicobacter sp. MIT 14-3879]|uniref:thiamine phosphate synthase n=1 Tax=Helicobacter sp. MIT 14-3879 TaxID=2040649 RepID=UPI000E1E78C5|nr:thiamine phosphate synthase [Helicobacter sp. MIT 14-3879]RDU63965.1 hypothetical protein CQA44_04820 [Helicobacter sp. MIT 14-3879]